MENGLSRETWSRVVEAIEAAIPLYDQVNELVSLGKAQQARKYAIERLRITQDMYVLDSGIGPGTTSRLILGLCEPALLVGLDQSVKQLKTARENLGELHNGSLQLVRGSFESLPFRNEAFAASITSYALRDSLDLPKSLGEYCRVCNSNGAFADVDLGKPINPVKRVGGLFYVRFIMPVIAKIVIRGKIKGNPWRMIGPTYVLLPNNREMLNLFRTTFKSVESREFLMGGVIVMIGRKIPS